MEERYRNSLYIAIMVLITGAIMNILQIGNEELSNILINIGVALIAVLLIRMRRTGNLPEKDERTKKLGAYGLSYSWLITFLALNAIFWIDRLEFAQLTVSGVMFILGILMLVTAKGFQWYFLSKGDVD
jgi:predicted membrane channel-forming protein YqfA (hemolysin III family)